MLEKFVKAFLTLVAGVFLGVVWVLVGKVRGGDEIPQKPVAAAVKVESCDCDAGTLCTGPRGGTYCITKGGSKRYF